MLKDIGLVGSKKKNDPIRFLKNTIMEIANSIPNNIEGAININAVFCFETTFSETGGN